MQSDSERDAYTLGYLAGVKAYNLGYLAGVRAFNLGYLSCVKNVPKNDCPYEEPYLQDAWIDGWHQARTKKEIDGWYAASRDEIEGKGE